ncbi:MAG: Calx-beta domain-containing protein, partial [Methylococcales bacterium]
MESIEGDTGNKSVVFKVNLSSTSTQTVSFTVKTVDKTASAGSDYQAINATIKTMPAGTQSLEISVPILGDKNAEGDEVFNLELSKISNAVFDSGVDTLMVKGTILDDDKPIIRIEDVHVVEGNGGIHDAKIKVTLSTLAATQVTLHYKSIDATAKAGEDYISTEEDLIIPAGAKEGYISVSIQGDTIPEAAQDFHIQLSSPINAQFLNAAATIQNTVTIDSDDGDNLPIVTVSKNLAIDEGDSGLTYFPITLNLSSPATDTLTIQYQTIAVDAKAGSDFITDTRMVTFLARDTSQIILLRIHGDEETESDEDFTLLLTDPQGMRFSNGLPSQEITLLIQDDDAEPAQKLEGTPKNDILDATKDGAGTGDDSLNGLKGIDTMIGGDGDDTYYVDNIKDSIIEEDQSQSNAGDDDLVHSIATAYTLPVNVEHLIIDGKSKGNGTGNVLDNKLIGNLAVNVLSGLAGNDTLDGRSGNDALTGGLGNDTFIFSSGIKGNKNIDTVKDFVHGEDKLYLNATIFSKLAAAVKFVDGNAPVSL